MQVRPWPGRLEVAFRFRAGLSAAGPRGRWPGASARSCRAALRIGCNPPAVSHLVESRWNDAGSDLGPRRDLLPWRRAADKCGAPAEPLPHRLGNDRLAVLAEMENTVVE